MQGNKRYQFLINMILVFVTLFMVLPIVLLFMSSITSENTLIVKGYSYFPSEFGLEGYRYIFNNSITIFRAYGYTIGITFFGTIASMLITMLMAFPLSLAKLPGRRIISFYVLFTMLYSGGLVPSYIMWTSTFHIKNTVFAYIFPGLLMSAMNVILMRTFFQNSIPESLYEAAEIDGAGYLAIFRMIVIPLSKPIIVTISMFSGLNYWNNWMNGLYYINDKKLYTIQVLLNNMIQNIQAMQSSADAGMSGIGPIPSVSVRMAIAFVALFPVLVIYPFLQKYFESGIMLGAVKG